jgi:excinuclease UvrABC helicase subunit UvrB
MSAGLRAGDNKALFAQLRSEFQGVLRSSCVEFFVF